MSLRTLIPSFSLLALFTYHSLSTHAQTSSAHTTILDLKHYSHTLGENRNFRVFLPPTYYTNPEKRFPVIYFMHGWSQRYFGDGPDAYASFDKGSDNKGDNIANYVQKHDVIVVKSDGYNRSAHEPYYVRPYNVSPVETHRQFPVYYPELINHVDENFRTIANRTHRGIAGLSMGGFMSFWIAAKYPHLFSAAGSFCGSPEFEVGPITLPTEYRHIDMYRNFEGVNLRLHYGDKDFIRSYHEDMNRVWPSLMDNYSFRIYDAQHSTAGMADMFDFILATFQNPPVRPSRWHHTDVYPAFTVWDLKVETDRDMPGFTVLENVDPQGFRSAVRKLLPDGELMPNVNVIVTTPPIYIRGASYSISDINVSTGESSVKTIAADTTGRLQIMLNGDLHEIGISRDNKKPAVSVASFGPAAGWFTPGRKSPLIVRLLNKGGGKANDVRATLTAVRNNAEIPISTKAAGSIMARSLAASDITFDVTVNDTADAVRLRLNIEEAGRNKWSYFLDVPVRRTITSFTDVEFADGRQVRVASAGKKVEMLTLGAGNGDGIPNPGEAIVVLVKDRDTLRRCSVLSSDPNLNPGGINMRRSDNWTEFDYVGGSAKYDMLMISSDCPENHVLKTHAEYWTAQYPFHLIKRGLVDIKVSGRDKTSPIIDWVKMRGDNGIEAKVIDGAALKAVKATFVLQADSSKKFQIDLVDSGRDGDRSKGDLIFSKTVPEQKFGIYRVLIEARDEFDNAVVQEWSNVFVVQ